MKNVLMGLGIFALLPVALPAMVVGMVIVGALVYWLAPLLWLAAVAFIVHRAWKGLSSGKNSPSGGGGSGVQSAGGDPTELSRLAPRPR
jgi:uncharacterized membrane protein YgcG